MPLEHSHGYSCESDQKLGHGTASDISRRGAASYALGGSFCIAVGRIKPETLHPGPGSVAREGEVQSYPIVYVYRKYIYLD